MTPALLHASSAPPMSARDAAYWLAVASTPSFFRSTSTATVSTSSSMARGVCGASRSHHFSHKSSSKKSTTSNKTHAQWPVFVAEEVYEHQRDQIIIGWGSIGHLLPLDPDKYVRVIRRVPSSRHCIQNPSHRPRDEGEEQVFSDGDHGDIREEDGRVYKGAADETPMESLEWSPSSTFPEILLPDAVEQVGDVAPGRTLKLRSRSAMDASRNEHKVLSSSVPGSAAIGSTPAGSPLRWEWTSPWHLEVPADSPIDAVDGWQYAASFSQFGPGPSRGIPIDLMSPSSFLHSSGGNTTRSFSPRAAGKRLRVRRRKWVRYRRLCSTRSGRTGDVPSSAFDDAFLDSMSGWLRKRGHVRKNWKARYFVLDKSILRYYTDSSCTKLKGEVLLFHPQTRVHYVDVHVAGGRDASFAIQVGPDYTLLLHAAQLCDRENWMYCIEDALLCRDSYYTQGLTSGPGPYFDLRESVAQRRLLSAEAMALDGSSFHDAMCGIRHAHEGALSCKLSDSDDLDDQSSHGQDTAQRSLRSTNNSDVLKLWASLHAKPGCLLNAVSSASPMTRSLLRACNELFASPTMHDHITSFLTMFRQKYDHPTVSSVAAMSASAWTRLSEPWAPVEGCYGTNCEQDLRESPLGSTPHELHSVTTLRDARSLLALKNYRFFLERSLGLIMDHVSNAVDPRTARTLGHSVDDEKCAPTDDELALARRAALYKLERRTFIPLQEVIYHLLGDEMGPRRGQRQEEERFERLRALVAVQTQSFLDIHPSHQSPTEWKLAIALIDSMDNYSLPSEKAAVLVDVARCIYETDAREHDHATDRTASPKHQKRSTLMSADDFLPIFIFVLARCHLRSVIVTRHLISETMVTALMIGETGYYATMLEAAIGYIAAFDGTAKTGEPVDRNGRRNAAASFGF
uniref:VPS9 domain-containing protein n=1 Tax=Peronospora matthiolae TaxID=2874970 RepID=A0AAV1TC73_9STRA